MADKEQKNNKSSSWLDRWAKQSVDVRAAIIVGILGVIGLLMNTLLDTWMHNRPTPTPPPTLACITADDILIKFQILRSGEMIATLSPSETLVLEPGWIVDFKVEITSTKGETIPTLEYTWTDTGSVTNGKLLHSAGRIVDYQSGWDIVDDAISLQLSQPGCPALAPYPFFILPNEE